MIRAISNVEFVCLAGNAAAIAPWLPFVRGLADGVRRGDGQVCVATDEAHHELLHFLAPTVELRPLPADMARPDPSPTSLRLVFDGFSDRPPQGALVLDAGGGLLIDHVIATFRRSRVLHVILEDLDGIPLATAGTPQSLRASGPANYLSVAVAYGINVDPAYIERPERTEAEHTRDIADLIERFQLIASRYMVLAFDAGQFATANGRAIVRAVADRLTEQNTNCVVLADHIAETHLDCLGPGALNARTVFFSDLGATDLACLIHGSSGVITNRADLAHLIAHLDHPTLSLWGGLAWDHHLPEAARGVAVGIGLPMTTDGCVPSCVLSTKAVLTGLDGIAPLQRELRVVRDEGADKIDFLDYLRTFKRPPRGIFTGGRIIGAAPPPSPFTSANSTIDRGES